MIQEIIIITGSNMGNRQANLLEAGKLIEQYIGEIIQKSSVYESEPWGYRDKASYLNQVIRLNCALEPEDLLEKCLEIEKSMGRVRNTAAYESRIIDIDILFYGNLHYRSKKLIIPHPHIQSRKFVLLPLNEIASQFLHPVLNKTVQELLNECPDKLWVKKILL